MNRYDFSSLADRVVMITGGSGHVGSALTSAFLGCGSSVISVDLAEFPGGTDFGEGHIHQIVDLADLAAVRELPSLAVKEFGRLDVIVCAAAHVGTSAGERWNVSFQEQDESLWAEVLNLNLTGMFTLVKSGAAPLAAHGVGSVVLLASTYAVVAPDPSLYAGLPIDNPAGYAVSKAGVTQLAAWLSTMMAPEVRVNALVPGGILREQDPEFVHRYATRTPLNRMATEDDLVGPTLFLASDLARYITGHNLVVDGGYSVW